MGLITLETPTAGTTVSAGLHAANYADIQAVVNGGLENSNISASAAIALSKLSQSAFSTYTPAWTTTGTAPSIGNGVLTGRYIRIGNLVNLNVQFTVGSTTTFGTGSFMFSIPLTANTAFLPVGQGIATDAGSANFPVAANLNSTTTILPYAIRRDSATWLYLDSGVTSTIPFAWGSGDSMFISISYEVA